MVGALRHRGPDANGVIDVPDGWLGHTRLKIIDLSNRAAQPMISPDRRHVLVYNGEIYNYLELRETLRPHHDFVSDSDTEVLLAAWRRWGEDALERLNGMFAFCVYDTQERRAFLARDRFGQKPLYYTERNGELAFASEVKALLATGIPAAANLDTWGRYLTTASYDDDASTFFAGIQQLQPGECATWSSDEGLRRRFYYRLSDRIAEQGTVSSEDAARSVKDLLVDAARLHMRSDVPVGVSLSGGLDSSALLACIDLAGALHPGVACFSVDFGGDLTEAPWIEAAAAHHGLRSHMETFTRAQFRETLGAMIWQLEGPIGGLMNSALVQVMAAARAKGVTVLQDGSGLDEAFGGYRNHHNLYLATLIASGNATANQAVKAYAGAWGCTEQAAREAAAHEVSAPGTAIDGTLPVRPDLVSSDFRSSHGVEPRAHSADGGGLKNSLIDYLEVRKIPRNARMKDRISMAFGIELRIPFLDHRLIEFALSLPPSFYFLDGLTKGIVRRALNGVMDKDVRLAQKRSIQAPQGQWLREEPMRSYLVDLIESREFSERGIFDVPKCRAAYEKFCAGAFENSFFVWQWINVEEWFRTFIDGDSLREPRPLCHELLATIPENRPAA